uniref:Uncharacterized protein n=1 Tax=Meloidogyne enterolobii TaxID=390850 RepID=A0A6V7TUS8_MELEN|nr:unnamed protein product [Meloidogyne enterolobii]
MCFLKLLLLFKLILFVFLTDCVERDDAGPSEASKYVPQLPHMVYMNVAVSTQILKLKMEGKLWFQSSKKS